MKATDVGWRQRIGNFGHCKIKIKGKCSCQISDQVLQLCIIITLLIIGCVEVNPGPATIKVNILDISIRLIQSISHGSRDSKNPRLETSKWGKISKQITGRNTLEYRNFVANLSRIVPQVDPEKYLDTCLRSMQTALLEVRPEEGTNTNFRQATSSWGFISNKLYSSNTIDDRRFLSQLWAIGGEINDLNLIPGLNTTSMEGPASVSRIRKKRYYNQEYYSSQDRRLPPLPSQSTIIQEELESLSIPPATPQNSVILELDKKFKEGIWQFATLPCDVCDILMYPKNKKKIIVDSDIIDMFAEINNEYELPSELMVCRRCYDNIRKGKVPPKAKINGLELAPVPAEISALSIAEVSLICQVKAYMKVYLLCNGRGQRAMKGMVVHFPQRINEVITQLPLTTEQSDFIIVNESGDRVEHTTTFKVRPHKVYAALNWLVQNNPLYANIKINRGVNLAIQSLSIEASPIEPEMDMHRGANVSYVEIAHCTFILRAPFCQSHELFLPNSGTQCTAMSASFLAHCLIDSPSTWCTRTIDDVLITGNDYYTIRRPSAAHNYLSVDEVVGTLSAFNGVNVILGMDLDTQAISFHGYANRARGIDLPRLSYHIQQFIELGYRYGIISIGDFSLGLYVEGGFTYFFDSHSRGGKGWITRGGEGRAFVMKIENSFAPSKISSLCNRNCNLNNIDHGDIEHLRFIITVFTVQLEIDSGNPRLQIVPSPTNSPASKIPRQTEVASDSEDDDIDVEPRASIPVFGRLSETDCVIERDDIIEPDVEAILDGNYNLNRENGSPLNEHLEKNLDLLGFAELFPHGVNGLNALRKIPLTILDYFQQRLMSPDKRFNGKTSFLFYGLSQCDKYRAQQKISVCCAQTLQNPGLNGEDENNLGARDPHVYMSSIRGTSSYWKKYTGDLIAMVKSLGVPTFFFTFSYDDLNSSDCINALWKAKHGPDTPEIKPDELPYDERKNLLNDYPIIAARHFSMRLSKFLALIKANGEEIFGLPLEDYSIRVEFQARGSPHAHCLFWLKGAPREWTTPEGIALLERNVSCSTITSARELVLKYQRHAHSKTCFKNNNSTCRFAFPRTSAEETKILNEDEIVRNRGRFFNLKRQPEETMIGYYHPILLPLLKCNMDIQPVTGAVGIAYYIAKYMSKAEPLEIRQDIHATIKTIQSSNLPARQKMFKIAMTLMRNREISAQEAAFRMCHLFLRYSSRASVFLPTFLKANRVRMLSKETIAQGTLKFCTNIIDRYMGRPPLMEKMCLFEFAAWYAPLYKSKDDGSDDNDVIEYPENPPDEEPGEKVYKCMNPDGSLIGKIFKRKVPAVVKFPNFHPITDKESYYYSLLLLYLPFRTEDFCDTESAVNVFKNRYQDIQNHANSTSATASVLRMELSDEIDRALLRITEFDELENEQVDIHNATDFAFEEPNPNDVPSQEEAFRPAAPDPNITARLKAMYRDLNPEQRVIFGQVNDALQDPTAGNFRQMVLANAGTGKSHLLKVLRLLIKNTLTTDALIVAAPTGKAAFPISGTTCHRAFGLPVQHGFTKPYQKLTARRLHDLRRLYHNVKWIFIDEISMVSYENFRMIHLRLCEIFGTDGSEPFAGKNMILWGDLLQLPPVRATPIFKPPDPKSAEVHLWRQFKFSELTINMRQGSDPLGKICDELRLAKVSEESLKLLKTRVIYEVNANGERICINPELEKRFQDAVRINPELNQCKAYNREKTKELRKTTPTYKIYARDMYADGVNQGKDCPKSLIPNKEDRTGGIVDAIELGVGSRVMLRRNIDTSLGHCNGATAVVKQIEWTIDKDRQIQLGDLPKRVKVRYDHEDEDTWVELISVEFIGKKQTRIKRVMLPFILAWSLNTHKLQGTTLIRAAVYLGSKCNRKGLAYVAISRVTTLEGLVILELDPRMLLSRGDWSPADESALAELDRLRDTVNNLNCTEAESCNTIYPDFTKLNIRE